MDGLPVRTDVLQFPGTDGNAIVVVTVSMPFEAVHLRPGAVGPAYQFAMGLKVVAEDGRPILEQEKPYAGTLTDAEQAAMQSRSVTYAQTLRLQPGRYTVWGATVDQVDGTVGLGQVRVDVPQPMGAVAASSLVLVGGTTMATTSSEHPLVHEGVVLHPRAGTPIKLSTESSVSFFLRGVAPGGQGPPDAHLLIQQGGATLAELSAPVATQPDGRFVVSGRLPSAALPPGHYTLMLRLTAAGQVLERAADCDVVQ
jgi:hypothetical protein